MFPFTTLTDEALERFLHPHRRPPNVPTAQLVREGSTPRPSALDEYAAWLQAGNRPVPAAVQTRTLEDRGLPPGPARTMEHVPGVTPTGRTIPLGSPEALPPAWTGLGFRGDERPASDADLERLRRGTIGIVPGSVRDVTPPPTPRDIWNDQTPAPATGAGPDADRLAMFQRYVQSPPMSWDGTTLTTRRAGPGLERFLRGEVRPGEVGVIGATEQTRIDPSTIASRLSGTLEPTPQQRLQAEQLFQGYLGGLTDLQHRAVSGPQLERERIASQERIATQQAGLQRDLERMRQRDLSAYLYGAVTGRISPDQLASLVDLREALDESGRVPTAKENGKDLRARLREKFQAMANQPQDTDYATVLTPAVKDGAFDADKLVKSLAGHAKVRTDLPGLVRRLLESGAGSPEDIVAKLEKALHDRLYYTGADNFGDFRRLEDIGSADRWQLLSPRGRVPVRYGLFNNPSPTRWALTSREDAARYRDELPLLADMLQQIYTVGNLGTKPKP